MSLEKPNTNVPVVTTNLLKTAVACAVDTEAEKAIKKAGTVVLRANIKFSDDKECNPNTSDIFNGYKTAKDLDARFGKELYKRHTQVINQSQEWYVEVLKAAEDYFMVNMVEFFINDFRMFCTTLKEFNTRFASSRDVDSIKRHFDTLLFAYTKLEKSYKKAKKLIDERKKSKGLYNQPSKFKKTISAAYTFVKFMWHYKYALYFVGILAFNTYDFVWLPYRDGLSTILRIVGVICFTFASDKIIMGKLLNVLQYGISSIMLKIINELPYIGSFYSFIRNKFPAAVLGAFNGAKAAFEYIILYFTLDFLQVITNMVCKGVLIFGAGYESGTKNMGDIWEVFSDAKTAILNKTIVAKDYIVDLLEKSSENVVRMMGFLFIDIIGGSLSNVWVGIKKSFMSKFTGDDSGGGVNANISALIKMARNRGELTTKEQVELALIDKATHDTSVLLRGEAFDLMEKIAPVITDLMVSLKQTTLDGVEGAYKKMFVGLEETMKKQGTLKLYKATRDMNLTGFSTFQVIFLFIILSLFSVGFTYLGVV